MRENMIDGMWESYLEDVVPPDAGPEQVEETRRAFYAGAAGLLGIVKGGMAGRATPAYIEQLEQELQAFKRSVLAQGG